MAVNSLFVETWDGDYVNIFDITELTHKLEFSYKEQEKAKKEGRTLRDEEDETDASRIVALLRNGKEVTLFYAYDTYHPEDAEGVSKMKDDSYKLAAAFLKDFVRDNFVVDLLDTLNRIANNIEGI